MREETRTEEGSGKEALLPVTSIGEHKTWEDVPMKVSLVRFVFCIVFCAFMVVALNALVEAGKPPPPPPPTPITRTVSMSTREDWDKGDDLNDVALDFALVNDLGVDELIMSIGWDDYEPTQGNYDFVWLGQFASLAATYGIKLRPYICYTPEWAGNGDWNSPPTDYNEWNDFCSALGTALSGHANVVSYEIWNEWNDEQWWAGTYSEYVDLLEVGSAALKAADTDADIVMGGLTYAHWEPIDACTQGTVEQAYEIVAVHCYREWYGKRDPLEGFFDAQWTDWFVPTVNNNGEGEPIWFNEVGFSTLDRGEAAQRFYFARAVPYLFGDDLSLGEVDHFDAYEIKDVDPNDPVIGPEDIRYLGLCNFDRTEKLAFDTVAMWVGLMDDETITSPKNDEVSLEATSGRFGDNYHYLIYRDEGGGATSQVLTIYDKRNSLTCEATLTIAGSTVTLWNQDGTSQDWTSHLDVTGLIISDIPIVANEATILEIMP